MALVRGIYNESTFCYTLEVVTEMGQVFAGVNSATNYQIQILNLADADSVSSASVWSSSATQQAWNALEPAGMPQNDPRQLGGLVLSARVCYDRDGDGTFEDPTVMGNNAASQDESYNVVLYIGPVVPAQGCGSSDFNADGDFGTDQDIEAFFACLAGQCCPDCGSGDFNADGDFGTDQDIEAFFRVLAGGTC
jgi:hypothetical protein